jgi:hypothetical protein
MIGNMAICSQCDNGYAESTQVFDIVTIDNIEQTQLPWQITYSDVEFVFCVSCQILVQQRDAQLVQAPILNRWPYVRRCKRINTSPDRYLITQCGIPLDTPYPNSRYVD